MLKIAEDEHEAPVAVWTKFLVPLGHTHLLSLELLTKPGLHTGLQVFGRL
jgi:hypothetical protein